MLDDEPLLSDSLLALGEWMAQYYLAPLGEVLRGMLPLMAEVRRTVYYRITDLGRDVLAESVEGEAGDSQVPKCETWGTSKLLDFGTASLTHIRTVARSARESSRPRSRIWSGGCWRGWPRASR